MPADELNYGKVRVFQCVCGVGLRQRLEFAEPIRATCANCGYDLSLIEGVVADAKLDTLEWLAEAGHRGAAEMLEDRKIDPTEQDNA